VKNESDAVFLKEGRHTCGWPIQSSHRASEKVPGCPVYLTGLNQLYVLQNLEAIGPTERLVACADQFTAVNARPFRLRMPREGQARAIKIDPMLYAHDEERRPLRPLATDRRNDWTAAARQSGWSYGSP